MKHLLFCLAMLLGPASLSACAQAPQPGPAAAQVPSTAAAPAAAKGNTPDERARQALLALNPKMQIDYIGAAALPGFREVIVGGQVVLVSDDGKYLVQGSVVDIGSQKELTQSSPALSKYRQDLLKSVKTSERIVFAPPNPKYTLSVFTDIECGYCRKLHSEIAEYNKRGIAIEYMAFPRMGLGSQDHRDMISVWCATDRKQALTDAKGGKPVPVRTCKSTPVDMEYHVGQRLGISGTPAIFAPDGTQLGGYLPPDKMREALDKLAGEAQAVKPAGMQ
ncbi:thioredoxin fold domain-containing protein [Pseudoxanthomonas sp. CF125]|uniref:thioredoxin fold domain-containing protein n=1 Tax=Pseudoxanthomonas sp. CF125 TaxID=1855303 RepID=UPI000881BDC4|nr:thioredoxin fold domain-containing protein [Pseudoxanthomonas sp. CF125]SDQ89701.1 thiol:disulfide interchange protein DsbC [Pseudoxanthomonas sp. CF125]